MTFWDFLTDILERIKGFLFKQIWEKDLNFIEAFNRGLVYLHKGTDVK